MAVHCPKCDRGANQDWEYCPYCGAPLSDNIVQISMGFDLNLTFYLGASVALIVLVYLLWVYDYLRWPCH